MQENFEAEQEGSAKGAARKKVWWRVPFTMTGTVTARAETPGEAVDLVWDLTAEGMVPWVEKVDLENARRARK